MLSIGIRFGQGFDKPTLLKFMEKIPMENDFEFLVIGTDPGGVECAKQASLAGKRTAIVKWRHFTPVEREIIKLKLDVGSERPPTNGSSRVGVGSEAKTKTGPSVLLKSQTSMNNIGKKGRVKRMRKSNIDLVNELFKRGHQVRKLMHNVGNLHRLLESAQKCGWRVGSVNHHSTLNWGKMMDQVMDFVMEENWKLLNELDVDIIQVQENRIQFLDEHTVKVDLVNGETQIITADLICLALEAEYKFPSDVAGATDFGIDCNDFLRMVEPPGRTLVVGGLPESMECAGILTLCNFPVTVISRSKILEGYDSEITKEIKEELKRLGVKFLEDTSLMSIALSKTGVLVATYETTLPPQQEEEGSKTPQKETATEEFDTVLFAVGSKTNLEYLKLSEAKVKYNSETQKIYINEEELTTAPNIYAVGDAAAYRPQGFEISELAGRLLGKRLFQTEKETMNYTMFPFVMFTPTEYAFIGLSEDGALYRFGSECIDIYRSYFKPLEYVLPPRKAQCLVKVIVFSPQDLVIGLHLFGPEAGEVIQGFAASFKFGLTMSKLRTVVGVHATKAEKIVKLTELKSKTS